MPDRRLPPQLTPTSLVAQFRATPNLLSMLRLFLVPFLVISILDHHSALALLLFLLCGLTDALDGRLARHLGQSTRLGQYLDPIADKLLLSTLFLTVHHMGLVPRYVTVLVFARDLGILLISTLLYVTHTLRDFRPSLLGKLNTVVQIVTMFLILVEQVATTPLLSATRTVLILAIAWLAPLSAAQYAWIVVSRMGSQPVES